MKKISILDRLILLAAAHMAGYQIIKGLEGFGIWPSLYFTIAFGAIILSCLLLILFGFDILGHRMVVVAATLIPLSLSLGLVSIYAPRFHIPYAIFAAAGFILIVVTRIITTGKMATIALASVHGIAGLVLFAMPLALSIRGATPPLFVLTGIGGAVFGLAGMLLAFLRMDKPLLSQARIYSLMPLLLLVTTALFVIGMSTDSDPDETIKRTQVISEEVTTYFGLSIGS